MKRGEWEGGSQPGLSSRADIRGTGPRRAESGHNPPRSEFPLPHPYFSSRQGKNKVWILHIRNFIYNIYIMYNLYIIYSVFHYKS